MYLAVLLHTVHTYFRLGVTGFLGSTTEHVFLAVPSNLQSDLYVRQVLFPLLHFVTVTSRYFLVCTLAGTSPTGKIKLLYHLHES